LQDERQRFARISARIAFQDQQTIKERGQLYQLLEGMSDEEMQIVTSVRRRMTRALDLELREAVDNLCVPRISSTALTSTVARPGSAGDDHRSCVCGSSWSSK
jgi:hypothetical protein